MKAKEKGIPESEVQKGGSKPSQGGKWNAFREMNKIKSGGSPMLAKIPDGVKVVGTPGGIHQRERDNGKKRSRDDDGEEGSAKRERVDVSLASYVYWFAADVTGAQDFHPQLQGR
jgi:hypothetical protein